MPRAWLPKFRVSLSSTSLALVAAAPVVARNLVGVHHTGWKAYDCWFEHGWPECFLGRSGYEFYGRERFSDLFPWSPWGRAWVVSPLALLVDLFISAVVIWLSFRALREWRSRSFHVSLLTLLIGLPPFALLMTINIARERVNDPPGAYFRPTVFTSLAFSVSLLSAAYATWRLTCAAPARRLIRAILRSERLAPFRPGLWAAGIFAGAALGGLFYAADSIRDRPDAATLVLGIAIVFRWRRSNAILVALGGAIAILSVQSLLDTGYRRQLLASNLWHDPWFEHPAEIARLKRDLFLTGLGLHLGVCYCWWCRRRASGPDT